LVNHVGGGAILACLGARFVVLEFILCKMRSSMVNAAFLFARRMIFPENRFPLFGIMRIPSRNPALIAAGIQGSG
jgi:hypothetical protein